MVIRLFIGCAVKIYSTSTDERTLAYAIQNVNGFEVFFLPRNIVGGRRGIDDIKTLLNNLGFAVVGG